MKTKTIVLVLAVMVLAACGGGSAATKAEQVELVDAAIADVGAQVDASPDRAGPPDAAPDGAEVAPPARDSGSDGGSGGQDASADADGPGDAALDADAGGPTEAAAPEAATCSVSWTDVCYPDGGSAPAFCGPVGPAACGYDCGNGTAHYTLDPQYVYWQECADGGTQQVLTQPWQTCGADSLVHCANAETCALAPFGNVGTIVCDGETYFCGTPAPQQCP